MADSNCRLDIPEVPELKTAEITVGREFFITCTGPWPQLASEQALQFDLPKEQTYILRLLGAEKLSGDTVRLKVTSYQVGQWNLENVPMTDGTARVELGPIQFETRSVMNPLEPRQEPYPLMGPLKIGIPLSWWLTFGIVILATAFLIIAQMRKRWQRKRLLESLRRHDSAQAPLAEFHQTLRRLRRDSGIFAGQAGETGEPARVVAEVEKAFRLFFLRRFRLPAFDWGDSALLRILPSEYPGIDESQMKALRKLLSEFKAARVAKTVEARDAVQLSEQSRKTAESLEKAGGSPT